MPKRLRGLYERKPNQWWIRYADSSGRIRREKAGTWGMARDLYHKRKLEALQGKKLPETLRQAAVAFKQIAEEAILDIQSRYKRPADDVARLRTTIEWFGTREAGSLTPGEIQAKLTAVATAEKWAASTINHHRSVMSLAYRIAKRDGKVKTNPVRDVPHRQEHNNRVRSLTPTEEAKLRKVIQHSYPAHEDEFDFAINTGLRQGTQFRLTWEMVNLKARELRIPQANMKNAKPLTLPLNDAAMKILRRLHKSAGKSAREGTRVFLSEETGRPLNYPKHYFTKAVREAGIKDFHWHDIRHCFATRLRRNGVPLEDIADLMAHKGLAMTKRYAHTDMGRLHQAVAGLRNSGSTGTTTDTDTLGEVGE
jgi:integrase